MRFLLIVASCLTFNPSLLWAGDPEVQVLNPKGEPGDPMLIGGTIYLADGETPAANMAIYVYHTDIKGHYNIGTTNSENPRIKANFKTDSQGRFAFKSIVPGPYPDASVPAHIHMRVYPEQGSAQHFELQFEGDPYLSAAKIKREKAKGKFTQVRKLTERDGFRFAEWNIRLR